MTHHHLKAQLEQLLRDGYSIEDIRSLVTAPKNLMDQAIAAHKSDRVAQKKARNLQRSQAEYAMCLGSQR
ncbi:hypothetical protein [Marinobacterium jannaschii]|uniref:hypothetical protein n=1 Tax=Marinobacterium jannaschii TaxID=64970 RepID=UPI0004808407|nr:hypothetical protein [Marinobacterium jannaschii]